MGLRNPEVLVAEPQSEADSRPWVKAIFRDPAGVLWHELDVAALAGNMQFLEVGRQVTAPVAAAAGVFAR